MSVTYDAATGQYVSVCPPPPPACVPPHPPVVITAADMIYPDANNAIFVRGKKLMVRLVSSQEGNYARYGNDRGIFIDGNDVLSNADDNMLRIDNTDKKIKLTPDAFKRANIASVLVSDSTGNLLDIGRDGLLFLSASSLVSSSAGNLIRISSDDGLLYVSGAGASSALISSDADNGVMLGSDGLLYVPMDCGEL